jgi:hypothetical protein
MKFLLVVCCVFLRSIAIAAESSPIVFKGLVLGDATFEQFRIAFPDWDCNGGANMHCIVQIKEACWSRKMILGGQTINCINRNTYGGVEFDGGSARFDRGTVHSVSLSYAPPRFDALVGAVADRYGKPNSQRTESIQTLAGVNLENKVLIWTSGGVVLTILKYGPRTDSGLVTLSTESSLEVDKVRRMQSIRDGAKDL